MEIKFLKIFYPLLVPVQIFSEEDWIRYLQIPVFPCEICLNNIIAFSIVNSAGLVRYFLFTEGL